MSVHLSTKISVGAAILVSKKPTPQLFRGIYILLLFWLCVKELIHTKLERTGLCAGAQPI